MADQLSRFKQWLIQQRPFRVAWFAKDARVASDTDQGLSELPEDMVQPLLRATNQLSTPPEEQQAVVEKLQDAIARWLENPREISNSFVMLAHPVSPIARILAEGLTQLEAGAADLPSIRLLDWIERPIDPTEIQAQIASALGRDSGDDSPGIAIIPDLCWCFLRSAEGLDGIDYLQEQLLEQPNQFWVIGSGQIGWEYLCSTLKLDAYCRAPLRAPGLDGEHLQQWLEPIVTKFDIYFSDTSLPERLNESEQLVSLERLTQRPLETATDLTQEASKAVQKTFESAKEQVLPGEEETQVTRAKQDYFKRLADVSQGISTVALQLFITSLRLLEVTEQGEPVAALDDDQEQTQNRENVERRIVAQAPVLPLLPDLSQNDLYLLYSLMLHGDLKLQALASSLGDSPQTVANQIQMLRNAGVVEQKDGIVKINPVHYPRLRRKLAKNNFIIEVP